MKNVLKNKLLIVFVLIALFILCMCSNVFATSIDYEGSTYTLSSYISSFPYILITKPVYSPTYSANFIYVVLSTTALKLNSSAGFYPELVSTGSDIYYCKLSSYQDLESCVPTSFTGMQTLSGSAFTDTDNWLYSSADIIDYSSNEVVFQGAPQVQTPQVELMKPTLMEEIIPQMLAIIPIVLPICLVIFGVLLVLFLIKSKNLLHL